MGWKRLRTTVLVVLWSIIHKMCIFSVTFFWIIKFSVKPANRKSNFVELKNLFLIKFLVSALDQSHHLIVRFSRKSACENHDAVSARSAVCFLQPILKLSKKSSCPPLWLRLLYLYASDVHQHTFNRSE